MSEHKDNLVHYHRVDFRAKTNIPNIRYIRSLVYSFISKRIFITSFDSYQSK